MKSRLLSFLALFYTGMAPSAGTTLQLWTGSGYAVYTFSGTSWSPGVPAVNVGESVFINIPCATSSCITFQCAVGKTVECGSNWTFDPPAVSPGGSETLYNGMTA